MIECADVRKADIRKHYNLATPFYRLFWGPHIHHGLWRANETPDAAARALTSTLAATLEMKRGARVLDVGCGMGGSSLQLARDFDARVTGITISGVQRWWAATSARMKRLASQVEFRRADAEAVEFPPNLFDVIWSIECTEHLFDKGAFFRRAATWLKPGGRMAICAWLAGPDADRPEHARQVHEVCEGFLCPSLATMEEYAQWMTRAGLEQHCRHDWTADVLATWEICRDRVERSGIRWLAGAMDRRMGLFLDRFNVILNAYRSGAMQYGCLVFTKPAAADSAAATTAAAPSIQGA